MVVVAVVGATVIGATRPATAKYSSIVVDATSGQVLYARKADTQRYPASLTKIMTLYMVFDALQAKQIGMGSKMRISARAARQPPSKLGLSKGQTIRVDDAIMSLVTKSANDIAVAVAEHMAGSEANFARRMTAKAREIGMSRTTFRNASGLPHSGQRSTARDMALLGRAIIRDFPQYYRFFAKQSFTYNGRRYRNHNRLLGRYDGIDGIKTGYINASGFNLVASVSRDGRRLIGVVFGGRTAKRRDAHMRKIIDKSFVRLAKYVTTTPPPIPKHKPGKYMRTARVHNGWKIQVGAYDSYDAAKNSALAAAAAAARLINGAPIAVVPLRIENERIFRAQIRANDAEHARQACELLKRKRFDCVTVPPRKLQLSLATSRSN